jgi:formaldehyde-activating enzyme involved in methanogenesis
MDGEFRSRRGLLPNETNFSLGHFPFLAYIVPSLNKSESDLIPNQKSLTIKNTKSTKKTR